MTTGAAEAKGQALPEILSTRSLTKRFGAFTVIDDLDLVVREGTFHALIGPNGAGKTTCFNLLSKFLAPTEGSIHYRGQDITTCPPADIARLGVVRSFQISAVFPNLTVAENILIALQQPTNLPYRFWRSTKATTALLGRAQELASSVNLADWFDRPAGELSYGRKRALEIATTLALEPDVFLLDEPMAGMGAEDIAMVSDLIRDVAKGKTVVMIEHNLNVVKDLCETITVLQRGSILAEGDYLSVSQNQDVLTAYLGADHE